VLKTFAVRWVFFVANEPGDFLAQVDSPQWAGHPPIR